MVWHKWEGVLDDAVRRLLDLLGGLDAARPHGHLRASRKSTVRAQDDRAYY